MFDEVPELISEEFVQSTRDNINEMNLNVPLDDKTLRKIILGVILSTKDTKVSK